MGWNERSAGKKPLTHTQKKGKCLYVLFALVSMTWHYHTNLHILFKVQNPLNLDVVVWILFVNYISGGYDYDSNSWWQRIILHSIQLMSFFS